ncbi:hypothetical protein RvY_11528 [Ramazzottius varieornatus]|uniref:Uncharacterized protein n=1 Tax=Ramazzottius varieornatus TaxID=947166 RepID=A0A1D1VGH2_RAMVA|nr:hypothetical protein RvY_11528 [Ramazzottius varieornatus]
MLLKQDVAHHVTKNSKFTKSFKNMPPRTTFDADSDTCAGGFISLYSGISRELGSSRGLAVRYPSLLWQLFTFAPRARKLTGYN